ncbi:hypothetical protein Bbelb_117360 [Branchiostoma belcheri]|nr:hypothetical protein Bbelb_117360 [Branchiostoma belcheri]
MPSCGTTGSDDSHDFVVCKNKKVAYPLVGSAEGDFACFTDCPSAMRVVPGTNNCESTTKIHPYLGVTLTSGLNGLISRERETRPETCIGLSGPTPPSLPSEVRAGHNITTRPISDIIEIIDQESRNPHRKMKEAVHIQLEGAKLNRTEGIKRMEETRIEYVVQECVKECPLTHYDDNGTCRECSSLCQDVSSAGSRVCTGPAPDQCHACSYRSADGTCTSGCNPGQKAVPGTSDGTFICQACRSGYRCVNGDQVDEICPAGTYSNAEGTDCDPCPAGQYSGSAGSTSCTICPAGRFSARAESTSCTVCPADTFSSSAGSTSCQECPAGTEGTTGSTSCSTSCPTNGHLSLANGKRYVAPSDEQVDYATAQARCAAEGGTVALPLDSIEQAYLVFFKNCRNQYAQFWLGVSRPDGTWVDSQGSALGGFTAWAPGEPDDPTNLCSHLVFGGTSNSERRNKWADAPCGAGFRYICKTMNGSRQCSAYICTCSKTREEPVGIPPGTRQGPDSCRPNCKSRSAPYHTPHGSRRATDRAPDGSLTETGRKIRRTLGAMTPAGVYAEDMPNGRRFKCDSQKIIFPGPRGIDDYARMETTLSEDLTSFTLCVHMRSNMDSSNAISLVSYAVPEYNNELLLFFNADLQDVTTASKVCSEERKTSFSGSMFWKAVLSAAHATTLSVFFSCRCTLPVGAPNTPPTDRALPVPVFRCIPGSSTDLSAENSEINGIQLADPPVWDGEWHTVCTTWSSSDGAWQLYADGVLTDSGSGFKVGGRVRTGGTWILGQDQDEVGGRFQAHQSLIGELSNVNLWDRVLSPAEIAADCSYHGNVIDWDTTNIGVFGDASRAEYQCTRFQGTFHSAILRTFHSAILRTFHSAILRTFHSAILRTFHSAILRTFHSAILRTFHSAILRTFHSAILRTFYSAILRTFHSALPRHLP